MNKHIRITVTGIAVVLMGVVFSSSGCRKKKDTIAKIYVRDASSTAVSGAQVRLHGESTQSGNSSQITLDMTSTTNASGEAIFNFNDVYQLGQAGVAVANIDVTTATMVGSGIIKVEEEKTSEETVFVQ